MAQVLSPFLFLKFGQAYAKSTKFLYNHLMFSQDAEVLPVNLRKRIPYAAIEQVVAQIAVRFNPRRIILFGSYAYGKPRPESDVDLLVVMDTKQSEVRQAIEIYHSIEYHFGLDILVYTPDHLKQRVEWGDSFLKEITSKGQVMYESAGS